MADVRNSSPDEIKRYKKRAYMFSSLGTSNSAGFFSRLRDVLEPCSKETYSAFGPKLPTTEMAPTGGSSLAGLGDPRILGTANNSW